MHFCGCARTTACNRIHDATLFDQNELKQILHPDIKWLIGKYQMGEKIEMLQKTSIFNEN